MNPVVLNATAFANEAWIGTLPFIERDDEGNEQPVDLTDTVFSMQLRRREGAATVDLALSTATGELFLAGQPSLGLLAYDVPVNRVRNLSGEYVYDLLAWPASRPNEARVWMRGLVKVSPGVTR